MAQHVVVDRFWITPALDPLTLTIFAAFLLLAALITARRPSYGVALLFLAVPLDFAHAVAGITISFLKAGLIGALVALAARADARRIAMAQMPRLVPLAFAAILLAIAVSGFGVANRSEVEVIREFVKWVEFTLLFLCAYVARTLDNDDAPMVVAVIAATLLVCGSALLEEFTGAPSGLWVQGVALGRVAGFLEGPNQLGGYLALTLSVLLSWNAAAASRLRMLAAALATLTLLLTFSRAAYFDVLVVSAIVCVAIPRNRLRTVLVPLALGIVTGLASMLVVAGHYATAAFVRTDAQGAGGVGTRSELWRAAWYFFKRHPLFGIGAGNYELRLPDAGLVGVRTHANSWYLQALAEGGVALFSATLFFLYAVLATLRRSLARSPWVLAAFAATVALFIHQFFDYLVFYHKVGEPWMILIGLGVAAATAPACES